jgi:hypothetical protein
MLKLGIRFWTFLSGDEPSVIRLKAFDKRSSEGEDGSLLAERRETCEEEAIISFLLSRRSGEVFT